MDRRRFLSAAASLVPALAGGLPGGDLGETRVIVARRPGLATEGGEVDAGGVRELLGRALAALQDARDPADVLSTLFAGIQTVGIKINCLGGWGMSTRPELVAAVWHWLKRCGIRESRMVVWDRDSAEMERAGHRLAFSGSGPRVFGTDARDAGYERDVRDHRSIGSCFSRILTTLCDAQIGLPVAKDHGLCGVTGALKNWFGAIHNPNKWHMNQCDPYIGDLNSMPLVRSRQRLVVLDMLLAQCNAGPAYHPRYRWAEGALVVGVDPVAVDSYLTDAIDNKRAEMGLPSLSEDGRYPRYIETAAGLGLGVADLSAGRVVEVE